MIGIYCCPKIAKNLMIHLTRWHMWQIYPKNHRVIHQIARGYMNQALIQATRRLIMNYWGMFCCHKCLRVVIRGWILI